MLRTIKIMLPLLVILCGRENCLGFQQKTIKGSVRDSVGNPIENVSVIIQGTQIGTYTDSKGSFILRDFPAGKELVLAFTHLGYRPETRSITPGSAGTVIDVVLKSTYSGIGEVRITSERTETPYALTSIPVRDFNLLPSASGGFEAILKTMPGVSSHNELSSQYSVRGGSFDENLVYVNDIEIFRPFLIRSGQQEGLSFVNPELVSSVSFSPGGFSASYGDRMSSVLDIRYRIPEGFHASVQAGLLLSSIHLEGADKSGRLSFMLGARHKSSKLMLKTLDAKGDYQPSFADIQSVVTLKTGAGSAVSLLASYSSNSFLFSPQSMTSTFGTEALAYRLFVLFHGGENDFYSTFNSALSWNFTGSKGGKHKIILSAYSSHESEKFDIEGAYRLDFLDRNTGPGGVPDSIVNIGIGSFLSHARNNLEALITSLQYRGEKAAGNISFRWGISLREDHFKDHMKEWKLDDSAGYSVPYSPDRLNMSYLIMSDNNLVILSGNSWGEATGRFNAGNNSLYLDAGLRGLYNSCTGETMITPRISAKLATPGRYSFWIAGGMYYQPPLYREMRYPDGSLDTRIRTQKSVHAVAGMSVDFMAGDRPFSFTAEIFNKFLDDIIPYHLDNVRVIYSGENSARGYSRGLDMRINGEFVEGAESWFSMSLMDSRLIIPGSGYGHFPSPADQTFSTSIFFQDYFPSYPTIRAHINLAFATGLPIISPFSNRYDEYYRLPAYRRVDIGITKVIKSRKEKVTSGSFLKYFDELVAGIEIFNLLDINNTVSYFWVRAVSNLSGQSRQYAVPDYLTGRCLNLKVSASF
ncbi:MAG TPA: TonB-dependent receptor [Bacteroidales bacterium]|nr:TonB-dependent receptor [Bacteroidales bacterium]